MKYDFLYKFNNNIIIYLIQRIKTKCDLKATLISQPANNNNYSIFVNYGNRYRKSRFSGRFAESI